MCVQLAVTPLQCIGILIVSDVEWGGGGELGNDAMGIPGTAEWQRRM